MKIGKKNILFILIMFVALYALIISYGEQYLGHLSYFILYIIVSFGLYINYTLKTKRLRIESEKELASKYKQLEILTSIYSYLDINKPLPETGGWAAHPDFLKKIIETILLKKPKFIVEASSGVSSIIIGYCFKKIGKGKVVSLEHDINYVEKSRKLISDHNLLEFVEIVHAPLKDYSINNKKWIWYDIDCLKDSSLIDMVVVDGPPHYIQELSRYPVIPLLYDKMSNNSVLVLDDGIRDEEKEITRMWESEFEDLSIEFLNFVSGAFIVNKSKSDNSNRTLLAFTTANQLEYNIKGLKSIFENKPDYIDVVVYDDASIDGTIEWCRDNNIPIITKEKALGLTHSWNLAYKKFKSENYKFLMFSNSDIIVPKKSLEAILHQNENYIIVSPLSTKKGVGHQPKQDVRNFYDLPFDEYNYLNTEKVQEYINQNQVSQKSKEVDYINGFFFSVNRDIIEYEYSDNELFYPGNQNVGNEHELCQRVKKSIAIVTNSYIYHFKGVSLEVTNLDNQSYEYNIYRDLNWQQAEKIKKSKWRKFWFKVKYKLKL
ncbi:MAG: class I SAM-dependent methyltransferase [Vicingaceae bacterium]|nr:class I SAM-dependent methyltransferase [Vicingaceae bacterium]